VRLARETEELEQRVAGRSHVIARTFGRVCTVLERLGYLSGDTVTPDGRRLARLYTELDLVAAECLRHGEWESLDPAELAACVSTLTFESRSPDDPAMPPRLPRGRLPDVLATMNRTWARLDSLEKQNGLSFLRPPDAGFAWAAYRWARGAALEKVLAEAPDLTPGDFVRAVKQLLDLLDQVAGAAGGGALTDTARIAITALRRGVVDYSGVSYSE
jgi:ATP-dependent RNA helicase HelY